MNEEMTSPVITLDLKDAELVLRLTAKIEEYSKRLEDNAYKAPEQMAGTIYRRRMIEELLREGRFNTYELSKKIYAEMGWIVPLAFNNSCGVVQDYVETGGANNAGSGLPILD